MINPLEWEFGPKVDLNNIGLQLYTVREEMNNDPLGTLKQVKSIGYTHIESAGYNKRQFYGQTKENFKMILRDQGLQIHSGHINTGFGLGKDTYNMTNNWEAVCEDAAFLGQKYIVCGWFAPDERKTLDDYKRFAQLFNKCGETAKKYNLQKSPGPLFKEWVGSVRKIDFTKMGFYYPIPRVLIKFQVFMTFQGFLIVIL